MRTIKYRILELSSSYGKSYRIQKKFLLFWGFLFDDINIDNYSFFEGDVTRLANEYIIDMLGLKTKLYSELDCIEFMREKYPNSNLVLYPTKRIRETW